MIVRFDDGSVTDPSRLGERSVESAVLETGADSGGFLGALPGNRIPARTASKATGSLGSRKTFLLTSSVAGTPAPAASGICDRSLAASSAFVHFVHEDLARALLVRATAIEHTSPRPTAAIPSRSKMNRSPGTESPRTRSLLGRFVRSVEISLFDLLGDS